MDNALALEALLELSQKLNSTNRCQLADNKFPLLDKAIVKSAMESVAYILEHHRKWQIPCTNLVKKWCDVRDIGVSCRHLSWMGTDSSLANIDCLLAVCNEFVDPKSTSSFLLLELHHQQAMSLVVISLADKNEKARKLTCKLFEIIIDHLELTNNHSDFLAKIWKLRGLLELSTKQIEVLVHRSPIGLEKELLSYAKNCLKDEEPVLEIYVQKEEIASLVSLCVSSPIIFQVTTSILMHLVYKSQAHQDIVNILMDFVQRCTLDERNVVKLFPVKCQVALALLNVAPEETDVDSYVGFLLDALADLPPPTATLLVILNHKWLPLLADKL